MINKFIVAAIANCFTCFICSIKFSLKPEYPPKFRNPDKSVKMRNYMPPPPKLNTDRHR